MAQVVDARPEADSAGMDVERDRKLLLDHVTNRRTVDAQIEQFRISWQIPGD